MLRLSLPSLIGRACLVALLLSATLAPSAHAEDSVAGEVLVILAKTDAGEIDPKLKELPALRKPPFNGFKSMKVLSTTAIELANGSASSIDLPNGSKLQLSLIERMSDGRHKVQVSISRPGKPGKEITVIASSEPFFVAGQDHEGGTLVIGVRVGGTSAKK